MDYLDYFISKFYDSIEMFFKTFTLVSGRSTLKVLYFSILYLVIAIVAVLFDIYTFIDIWSSLLAVVFLVIINCISVIQKKDIEKFKQLLKGDQ